MQQSAAAHKRATREPRVSVRRFKPPARRTLTSSRRIPPTLFPPLFISSTLFCARAKAAAAVGQRRWRRVYLLPTCAAPLSACSRFPKPSNRLVTAFPRQPFTWRAPVFARSCPRSPHPSKGSELAKSTSLSRGRAGRSVSRQASGQTFTTQSPSNVEPLSSRVPKKRAHYAPKCHI